jgi:hypothetical protein
LITLGLLIVKAEANVPVPQSRGVTTKGRKKTLSGSQPVTVTVRPVDVVKTTFDARPDAAIRSVI